LGKRTKAVRYGPGELILIQPQLAERVQISKLAWNLTLKLIPGEIEKPKLRELSKFDRYRTIETVRFELKLLKGGQCPDRSRYCALQSIKPNAELLQPRQASQPIEPSRETVAVGKEVLKSCLSNFAWNSAAKVRILRDHQRDQVVELSDFRRH